MALNENQQETLWNAWLSAEIRAGYFAALGVRYQKMQRALVCGSLLLSSGATLALLASVPVQFSWIKPMLTLLAALLSFWSLVAKNERSAIECSDLHFRWNTLAMQYEDLWANQWDEDAVINLSTLRQREAEISKSSTAMPKDRGLLERAQDLVVLQHQKAQVA